MAESVDKLTPKQEAAILGLFTSRSVEEAGRTADAYRRAKRAAFGQAISRLQQGAAAAATTMLRGARLV